MMKKIWKKKLDTQFASLDQHYTIFKASEKLSVVTCQFILLFEFV